MELEIFASLPAPRRSTNYNDSLIILNVFLA